MPFAFSLQSITMVTGVLYLLMALTVWAMLLRRHTALSTRLWSLGSLAAGLGLVLIQPRHTLPDWLIYQGAVLVLVVSILLRVAALRLDLGLALYPGRLLALGLVAMAGFQIATWLPGIGPHTSFSTLLLVAGNLALAWYARAAGIATPSRSGLLLAWAELGAAAGLLIRLVMVLGSGTQDLIVHQPWQFALLMTLGAIAAIYGNLGYLGIALDRHRAAERRALQASLAAQAERDSAHRDAADLRQALAQREALMAERDQLLQLLAHEIRQPLHNASGALQVLRQLLLGAPGAAPVEQAAEPLRRAQAVLGGVHSVLDNTLAAAMLLNTAAPPELHELELAVVINLALGDLEPAQRAAVQVQWRTDLRSVDMEPQLMRLAVRNLLRNAYAHGGPDVQVQLVLAERVAPPALLISVVDNGPGLGATMPDPGQRPRPGHGLGLGIVRQVARLHGGTLRLDHQAPSGLIATLVLPLPGADDAAGSAVAPAGL